MSEKKIENEFKKYKRQYIAKLGNHSLYNTEIDEVCKAQFGLKYRGCHAQDAQIAYKPGYYVFNTDVSSQPGEHWLAGYATKKTMYIFDTFARDITKLVPILAKRLRMAKLKIISSDRSDKEQRATNKGQMVVICGHSVIAWMVCAQKFGIRKSILI